MFFRFKNAFHRRVFSMSCHGVVKTGSAGSARPDVTIHSMPSHADLMMHLVAIKSLCRRLDGAQVIVLDDSSLTVAKRSPAEPSPWFLEQFDAGQQTRGLANILERVNP